MGEKKRDCEGGREGFSSPPLPIRLKNFFLVAKNRLQCYTGQCKKKEKNRTCFSQYHIYKNCAVSLTPKSKCELVIKKKIGSEST